MHYIEKKLGAGFVYVFLITLSLMMNTAASAQDDIPESCTGNYERIAYNAGLASGTSIVSMAWNSVDDCDNIELFETIVTSIVDRLTLPENSSTTVACRYAGYINGIMAAINDIYRECEALCYYEGVLIGDFAAKAYCDLSLAIGGLSEADDFIRAPVQLCGFNFEFACDVTFLFTTLTYFNVIGYCEQYTYGAYYDVWDQVRNNQCAYDIVLLPPFETEEDCWWW